MEDNDLVLARQLQEEFDKEAAAILVPADDAIGNSYVPNKSSSQGLSVIDPSWETTDPNPDVRALFLQYNDQYFWGKLSGVEVKWSPRMTLCAGLCSYEGRGGLCSIRLSVPLLKLRPRKDLVETLLHEMIHAFLFVTENDRDRDGHGPNFQKHMHRINKSSGAKITIYHDFHDEVDNYRQHWWRCDGPCRNRKPYFGWVKRAMNRAPSANDFWWEDHKRSCGGTYTKVKEPEGYGVKKKGGKEEKKDSKIEQKSPSMDIRSFLGTGNTLGTSGQSKATATNSTATKKTTSTVTGPGSYSSGDKKSPGGNSGSTSTVSSAFSSDFDSWSSGIWTPEKKTASGSSDDSRADSRANSSDLHSKQGAPAPAKQPTWTVVETKKDQEVKASSADKAVSGKAAEGAGHVLGSENNSELSWLARLRKQWAGAESNTAKPATALQPNCQTTDREEKQQKGSKTPEPSADSGACDKKVSQCDKTAVAGVKAAASASAAKFSAQSNSLSSNDDSFHDSFHVSSCEEDSWPTPEKYYANKKTSVCQSKHKRAIIDLSSSDEEDMVSPAASKRVKLPTAETPSPIKDSSDTCNIFHKVKKKNTSPHKDKTTSTVSTKFNGESDVRSKRKDLTDERSASGSKDPTSQSGSSSFSTETVISVPQTESDSPFSSNAAVGSSDRNAASLSLVVCPSCQRKVPSETINSHLDICLS